MATLFNRLMFRRARELGDEEVSEEVVEKFGEAAGFLEGTGVDGVEVHGAHVCEFDASSLRVLPPSLPPLLFSLAFKP